MFWVVMNYIYLKNEFSVFDYKTLDLLMHIGKDSILKTFQQVLF